MSTWEERMSANAKARAAKALAAARRTYLGDVFLEFYPPDEGRSVGFTPLIEVSPQVIAASCLGITYGDPGPRLPEGACRQCWGEWHVWLGNCWGMRHAGGSSAGCQHECHEGEVWLASGG